MTDIVKKNAPGRAERDRIALIELLRMFPSNHAAEKWLVERRWPNRVACVSYGSVNVQKGAKHKTVPFRCRKKECGRKFSVRTGTVMETSKMGHQTWVFAIYIVMNSLKGVSSMKFHRDLGIGQKAAWFLLHRLREAVAADDFMFSGPEEAYETYVGGSEKNKHRYMRMKAAGGSVGKAIVAGVRDRETGRNAARVIPDTKAGMLTGLASDHAEEGVEVFADEARGYLLLSEPGYQHRSVSHSTGQYVDDVAHTNGMDSFWSAMKRCYHCTYHQMSPEHLDRYVAEFQHWHNERSKDKIEQMGSLVRTTDRKQLTYEQLIAQAPHAKLRVEEMAA